jgi:hypothetical protein
MVIGSNTRRSSGMPERESTATFTPLEYGMLTDASEPAIIDAFETLWGTRELLVSFDGMNLTLPSTDLKPSTPWPHVDQNPNRKGMQCVQGILNLAPNGPDDGGLVVLKGSHNANETFFKLHPETAGAGTWGSVDWHGFNEDEVEWFKKRGCEEIKVCAEPGGKPIAASFSAVVR